jgi:hypothetical protein
MKGSRIRPVASPVLAAVLLGGCVTETVVAVAGAGNMVAGVGEPAVAEVENELIAREVVRETLRYGDGRVEVRHLKWDGRTSTWAPAVFNQVTGTWVFMARGTGP